MTWRDTPRRGLPEPRRRGLRWEGSPRQSEDGWCPATTVFNGLICECAKRAGHRGDHEDLDGVCWSEDLADY